MSYQPVIRTAMQALSLGEPKPMQISAVMEFNPDQPLAITFEFTGNNTAVWTVARQLIVDGLESVLYTGFGDVKVRSHATGYFIQLSSPEGQAVLCLPISQVRWVLDEAEASCPLADASIPELEDDALAAWLGESA